MKFNLIRYRFKAGTREEWHKDIERFVAALDADPGLRDKISYRAMKAKDGDEYFHLAVAADQQAVKDLGGRDYFNRYTQKTDFVSGDGVEVLPLEIIAETKHQA
jgi:hypothetical protein